MPEFPPAMHEGSNFSTSLTTFIFWFLITAIPMGMKWYIVLVFLCTSLMTGEAEHLFVCLLAIFICSLEKCLLKKALLIFFFNQVFFFGLVSVLYIFWIFPLIRRYDLQILSPILWVVLCLC